MLVSGLHKFHSATTTRNNRPSTRVGCVDLISKYFSKVREYERAYLEGHKAGKEVEKAVKK